MRIGPVVLARPGRILLAGLLALAACSREVDPPGAVSAAEDRHLNDAAASLDANAAVEISDKPEDNSR